MKKMFFILMFLLLFKSAVAQVADPVTEQQLENNTENNQDVETEDDSYQQQLQQFLKNPLNLNSADESELKELRILTPLQIKNLLIYRLLAGKLIDLYELQAVPGWHLETIQKLRPYIRVSSLINLAGTIKSRMKKGEHSLLLRGSQVLERSKGYLLDPATATNFYPGSPQKIMLRYKYSFKSLLQYGIVAEKDAGEQFFKGKQKPGFDFYSFHLFVRKLGIIRSLAIGDFTVNLGQGLIQWQNLAFKKSADVMAIKRESEILRPYNSAGEINFHRGVGITLEKKYWQLTAFVSYRKIDANFVADTLPGHGDYVSSLQTSGYHRTKSETDDKSIQRQLAFGGNLSYRNKRLYVGMNAVRYSFKLPLSRSADPYNKYALSGKGFGNYSFDYSYTFNSIHFFGEAAFTSSFDKAFIGGLITSVSSLVDMSLLYRNISRSYQSLYANAFTESTSPANEKGLFAGITIRPATDIRIDAYADIYKFPWLRFRVNAPSNGSDYLVQFTYKPNRSLEIYSRYHSESKASNTNPGYLAISAIQAQPKKNWRTQVSYRVNRAITLRSRAEINWFDKQGPMNEEGFLIFLDLVYKPTLKPFSGNLRLQYFETDGYNSRLYAYENDVIYSYSIPGFYGKGYRYYINFNYEMRQKLTLWVRWSQTLYSDQTLIGSGLDEITGNHKSEVRIQLLYKF